MVIHTKYYRRTPGCIFPVLVKLWTGFPDILDWPGIWYPICAIVIKHGTSSEGDLIDRNFCFCRLYVKHLAGCQDALKLDVQLFAYQNL